VSRSARFDPIIHAPHRLRICALLADIKELEFGPLRDALSVSDSVLSKQLAVLVDAGYVRSRRARRDARQRVWLALTPEGRENYDAHVAALHEIVGDADEQDRTARPRHLSGRYGPAPDLAQG
jgi:DNA-binding MarR family transcriptional regulator